MWTRSASAVVNLTVVRSLGAVVRLLQRRGSILCFHGLRTDDDPIDSIMNMTLRSFKRALELVRATGTIVPLMELHRRWAQGRSTRGLVAITFDDAYASLLELADEWYTPDPFPITIFVVTGASATGATFWWDRLEALTNVLSLAEWAGLEAACGMSAEFRGQVDPAFGPWQNLRQWILSEHAGRAPDRLLVELSIFEAQHNRATTQRSMQISELHHMAALGPVSFGVHTVSHPVLTGIAHEAAGPEVARAWEVLRSWQLRSSVPVLAAPYGLLDRDVVSLATAEGMSLVLALDDRTLPPSPALARNGACLSRLSMVEATSPVRLAYRLSGLRDVAKPQRGDPLQPRPQIL